MEDNTRCKHYLNHKDSENPIYREMGCYDCDGFNGDCPNIHRLSLGIEDNIMGDYRR
jgi:hypothetical protein